MKKEHVTPLKEKLISFETAKLAKEKGFHISSRGEGMGKRVFINGELVNTIFSSKDYIHAPTQSLLQKWLREVHEISIKIDDYYTDSRVRFDYNVCQLGSQEDNPVGIFETYEEALEIGLQEALKLIKNSYHENKL